MPDDDVTREFQRLKRRCKKLIATVIALAGGMTLVVVGAAVFHSRLIVPLAIAYLVIGPAMAAIFIVWSARYWRCPACKRVLPPISVRTVFCPRCGRRLQ